MSTTDPDLRQASLDRSSSVWGNLSHLRLLWLGGAIALIIAGGALAYFSPPPRPSASNAVDVPLPPASDGKRPLLKPAPDPGLVEESPNGPLPIIAKDGRQSWQAYARPFDPKETRPRIALIVTGIGLDQTLSQAALDRLPGTITFGFDPYADTVKDNLAHARSLGHEALLGLPLEPLDYPRQDPGPLTLLTSLDASQNADRLAKLMGKGTGYVGFVAIMGARFEAETSSLMPLLETLKQRGLMFADDKAPEKSVVAPLATQMKLAWAAGNSVIDSESDPASIDQALAGLEASAKRGGAALGIAALSPALLDRVSAWLPALEGKGIVLAPASAVANRQSAAQAVQ